jgi:phosphomannomutase/phosphoglucomutase
MSRTFFRDYDIRGPADDLDDQTVQRLGLALAELMRPASGPPRVVVGRDARTSSPRLHAALVEGLIAGGARVLDVGLGPSPLVYFAVHFTAADGGIVTTGSHNPPADNGFKILRGHRPLFGAALRDLDAQLDSPPAPAAERGTLTATDATDAYLARVVRTIGLGERRPRVVVDAGNGAAGGLGVAALRRIGLDPVCLFCDPDGTFPNRAPDPTEDQLTVLRETVVDQHADLGLAWDGDGDRLGVIDGNGDFVWGDRVLALFARQVLRENPGGLVLGEVKCSQALFDDVERHGGRALMTRTGHSHLKVQMKEQGALLGGEVSGHFFFADRYLGYDDAIYASLRLVEIVAREGRSVKQLLADLPHGEVTPEIRIECGRGHQERVVAAVRAELAGQGRLIDIDGVRIAYPDGAWGLVRPSNTSDSLVLRFEAPTAARLGEVRRVVEAAIERAKQRVVGAPP